MRHRFTLDLSETAIQLHAPDYAFGVNGDHVIRGFEESNARALVGMQVRQTRAGDPALVDVADDAIGTVTKIWETAGVGDGPVPFVGYSLIVDWGSCENFYPSPETFLYSADWAEVRGFTEEEAAILIGRSTICRLMNWDQPSVTTRMQGQVIGSQIVEVDGVGDARLIEVDWGDGDRWLCDYGGFYLAAELGYQAD